MAGDKCITLSRYTYKWVPLKFEYDYSPLALLWPAEKKWFQTNLDRENVRVGAGVSMCYVHV